MRRITFDIETIGEIHNGADFSALEVTVVGVHDSHTDTYHSFLREELSELWPLMEKADVLIGYNSDHFDIPILNRYYAGDLTKIRSLDLLKEIRTVLGRRLKLDNVAQATLGVGKSSNGLEAMGWWEHGDVEKVRKYCLDDVRITKEIYEYAMKNGSLKYKDFDGPREVKLDTSSWEALVEDGNKLTHTLPF